MSEQMYRRLAEWMVAASELADLHPELDDATVMWRIRQYDGGKIGTVEETARRIRQKYQLGEYAKVAHG